MGNHVHDTLKEFLTAVPLEQRNLETMVKLLRKKNSKHPKLNQK